MISLLKYVVVGYVLYKALRHRPSSLVDPVPPKNPAIVIISQHIYLINIFMKRNLQQLREQINELKTAYNDTPSEELLNLIMNLQVAIQELESQPSEDI